jgi:hypothetical protein
MAALERNLTRACLSRYDPSMTNLTGTARDIAMVRETFDALRVLTMDATRAAADLAAADPDADETDRLTSAALHAEIAVLALANAITDLAEACHAAHVSRGQ